MLLAAVGCSNLVPGSGGGVQLSVRKLGQEFLIPDAAVPSVSIHLPRDALVPRLLYKAAILQTGL